MDSVNSFHGENLRRRGRYLAVFIILAAAVVILMLLNIGIGSVNISMRDILETVFTQGGDEISRNIIWEIRIPRSVMAMLLGGALALAGFLLQTFFENPIAGPFVLGISSGAKMAVALTLIIILSRINSVSSYALIAAAFVGALVVTAFILLISRYVRHMATLLVAGIMIGYICSAISDFVITFAEDSDIVNLHGWSQGSFSGTSWENVGAALVIVVAAFVITLFMIKPIGAFLLGESYARSVGVNIKAFKVLLILVSSVLSACVTAFAGPISFVGIAVPFLIRRMLSTSKPSVVIPGSFLGGAVFCLGCDLIARTAFSPTELNISTVTAIFGAPIVIIMIIGSRRRTV